MDGAIKVLLYSSYPCGLPDAEELTARANLLPLKTSYDLVDHRDGSSAVHIFNERVDTKIADHTVSYILHYL
jgi:hypothetical protein